MTHHEEGAEVHSPEDGVLHLGDLEEDPEQLLLPLQKGQQGGSRALQSKYRFKFKCR